MFSVLNCLKRDICDEELYIASKPKCIVKQIKNIENHKSMRQRGKLNKVIMSFCNIYCLTKYQSPQGFTDKAI